MSEAIYSKEFLVTEAHSAQHWGSGSLEVLATPALVAFMENTAYDYVQAQLPVEKTTVGASIAIEHLAPTRIGRLVVVRLIAVTQDRSSYDFTIEAYEGDKLIATARHKRVAVSIDKFISRLS